MWFIELDINIDIKMDYQNESNINDILYSDNGNGSVATDNTRSSVTALKQNGGRPPSASATKM